MHKILSETHRLCVCGKQFTTIGGLQDHIKSKEPEEEEVMDEREKDIIYENIHSLRSLIGQLRAERDKIRDAWEPILNAMLKEHNPRPANYMEHNDLFDGSHDEGGIDRTVTAENITFGDLRKLAKLIGKEKP